ncbi:MAG: iron uptake porin [Cyanobacteria bacterium J06632_22]
MLRLLVTAAAGAMLGGNAVAAELSPTLVEASVVEREGNETLAEAIDPTEEAFSEAIALTGVDIAEPVITFESPTADVGTLEASLSEAEPLSSRLAPTDAAAEPTASVLELSQVTTVDELSDVSPADWAFTALQRLVEDYGCIEGYPDSTYRGNRAITRYEFAAGLNACLDVVLALLPELDTEELETIQRLQEEFAAELATLRGRIDTLELDVADLEANQFSTTTKLSGRLFTHLNYTFTGGDILAEGNSVFAAARDGAGNPVVRTVTDDPEPTFSYLTWLNLITSFTGEDRLILQLAAGDGSAAANSFASAGLFNTFGTPFTLQQAQGADNVILREAFYSFPLSDEIFLTVGPKINWYRHFDNNRFTFLVTGANSFNSSGGTQVNAVDRGSGIVVEWDVLDSVELTVGYLAESTEFLTGARSASDPSRGLFGGANTLSAQVGVYPTDNLNLRFLYTRSNLEANAAGQIGGAVSEPLYGFADDGFGGPVGNATADTFLFNFDWQPLDWLGLFGRYSYGSTNLFPTTAGRANGSVDAQSIQAGLAFPNLFKPGALATISYVRPFAITGGRNFLVSGGGDGGVQQELEVSYRYPISPNFAIVPSFYWIDNPNNFSTNPSVYVFNLQTQFSF